MNDVKQQSYPKWMKLILQSAGIYNVVWGAFVLFFPMAYFEWLGLTIPNYPQIWQSVGMIVGVYGLGYYISAYDPYTHWPVIFVGYLGKVFGPIGTVYNIYLGKMDIKFLYINFTNDLIWLIPFSIILYRAYQFHRNKSLL